MLLHPRLLVYHQNFLRGPDARRYQIPPLSPSPATREYACGWRRNLAGSLLRYSPMLSQNVPDRLNPSKGDTSETAVLSSSNLSKFVRLASEETSETPVLLEIQRLQVV